MKLRKMGIPADIAAEVALQCELRRQAATKLGEDADKMLFTRDGMEQATRAAVATWHAEKMSEANVHYIADLGCGLATEAIAFSKRALKVLGIELDPKTAAYAKNNVSRWPDADIQIADVTKIDIGKLKAEGVDALFADPARRGPRGRIANPAMWSPPLPAVYAWRTLIPNVAVKVAPGIRYSDVPADAEAIWASVDGSLVEASLWFGDLRERAGRSAIFFRGDQRHLFQVEGEGPTAPAAAAPVADGIMHWIGEVDSAVLRAGGLAQWAHSWPGAGILHDGIAYVTSETSPSPEAAKYGHFWEVQTVLPLNAKKVKKELARLGIGKLEVKKRGVQIDPAAFRKSVLKGATGDGAATLFLTRAQVNGKSKHVAIVATE
ncbi:hypothetical protein [Winkia sp. UMB0889B]|uniref:THUMP-like domain-containing protein n=1 Tax=Winkia sp. UMB0889B TaxID=3046315 RepID=UPI002555CE63|nr:hypothetical protein [Winkia sp. UMB0889B]MDK7905492.1 hypothetical protein [Winkia sp. UMB0889B]